MVDGIGIEIEEDGRDVVDDVSERNFRFDKSIISCNFLTGWDESSLSFVSDGFDNLVVLIFFLLRFFLINRFFCCINERIRHNCEYMR